MLSFLILFVNSSFSVCHETNSFGVKLRLEKTEKKIIDFVVLHTCYPIASVPRIKFYSFAFLIYSVINYSVDKGKFKSNTKYLKKKPNQK